MNCILSFFLLSMVFVSDCRASASVVEGPAEEQRSTFQPGLCLEMLSKEFQTPHQRCHQSLSRLSFKEMAESENAEFSSETTGMCWSWKLVNGMDVPTWYAAPCRGVKEVPAPKYALSFADLRKFYHAYEQLEQDSNMQKLWHMFFGK